jgi:hypothetical protein
MDVSDHRREYAAYCSAVELENFRRHAGQTAALDLRPIEERYSDLWAPGRLADLRRLRDDTSADFETERAGLTALVGAALLKRVEAAASDVTEELTRCETAARFEWRGAMAAATDLPDLLAAEADATRRRELAARGLDALGPCDDLRAARLDALAEAARAEGLDDRRSLYESFTGADLNQLAETANVFLERTERAYHSALAAWAARDSAPAAPRPLHQADSPRFVRTPQLDRYFGADSFAVIYAGTLSGLGIRAESQRNIRIDDAERAGKAGRSACFAVAPPEDVRLVLGARGRGADFYRRTLFEAGRAQMFAWASRETAARRPEFVHAPDRATEQGHAFLLAGLWLEPEWLAEFARVRAEELRVAARTAALVELHDARRDAALVGYALALDREREARSDATAESFAEALTRATGFRHEPAACLPEADEWFGSATRLRARAFAAGLREHLRSQHGRRWFASRAAGGELIDVWNTASRYRVEELARLLWGDELSFDLLAEALTAVPASDTHA